MSEFGSTFKKNLIGSLFGLFGVGGVLGAVLTGAVGVHRGSPISSVVKETAIDASKAAALDYINGDNSDFSLNNLIDRSKYKSVSDKKQGFFKQFSGKYYSEVYMYDNAIHIGNRRFNKPNGVNLVWSQNATDFEIGNYKAGSPRSGSYVAYDSESALLTLGELKRNKLNGYCLVVDEYSGTFKLQYMKHGENKDNIYITVGEDGNLGYYKNDKLKASWDSEKQKFNKRVKGNITVEEYDESYSFVVDGVQITVRKDMSNITYGSDYIYFDGNAFKFHCIYTLGKRDTENYIEYYYTTLSSVQVYQSDGTEGEVKVVSEDPTARITVEMLTRAGLKAFIDTAVDCAVGGNPYVVAADLALQAATGQGLSDAVSDLLIVAVDSVQSEYDEYYVDHSDEYIEDDGNLSDIEKLWNQVVDDRIEKENKKQEEREKKKSWFW